MLKRKEKYVIKKKILYMIAVPFIILYIIQFLIMPILTPSYYPVSNEALAILYLPLVGWIIFGMILLSDNMKYWLLGDILYILLIWIYPAQGAYGTGYRGINLDGSEAVFMRNTVWFDLLFLISYIIVIELIIKFFIIIIKKLINH